MAPSAFVSARIFRTRSITLNAPLKSVFPLFGPVREKDWAAGWDPQVLYSTTGVIEEHMVFKTRSPHEHESDFTWIVSKYDPVQAFVEYTVFTPERLWCIAIQCREDAVQKTTEAEVTYTYTGLTEEGNAINYRGA